MVDPRERRMQRLKDERRAELPKTVAKNVAIGVVAVLVVGGLGWAIFNASTGDDNCPGHWHATVGVWVDDERKRFPQPPYVIGGEGGVLPLSMHMHTGDDEQLHFEPPRRTCMGVEATMDDLGVELSADRIALVGGHEDVGQGGTWTENETHELRFFIQEERDPEPRELTWAEADDLQLPDKSKFMIAFGAYTDEEIAPMMDQIRWPSGAVPQHPG